MRYTVALTALLASSTLSAQATPVTPSMSSALQRSFASVADYLVRAAEQMPAEKYSFRATDDTRTFAQEIGHVADSHYFFCARVRNEPMPQRESLETATDKAALVAGLKASVAFCKTAYDGLTDPLLASHFETSRGRGVRLAPASNNVAHDNEHYGKIVTLLRMNKLVPPSSQAQ
jgi:uncharacterized damage-inducible protein DinB